MCQTGALASTGFHESDGSIGSVKAAAARMMSCRIACVFSDRRAAIMNA